MVGAVNRERDPKEAASEKPTCSFAGTELAKSLDLPLPEDLSYVTGRVLYPNSGTVVNG